MRSDNLKLPSVQPPNSSYIPSNHWMTIPEFWPKPIQNFLKPILFFLYQIFRNSCFFFDTKFSKTETDIIFDEIFSKYCPPFPSLFFTSSRKKIFSFSEYFPSFSFPPELNVNVNVNVAVFAFLHLIDRSKTKKDHNSKKRFALFTWSSVFIVICFFLFRNQVFRNQNQDFFSRPNFPKPKLFSETKFSETETETFFRDQLFRNRNRDFFPIPNFPKPKPRLFVQNQILRNPLKNWQKSRNREVSKPKCQSLVQAFWR